MYAQVAQAALTIGSLAVSGSGRSAARRAAKAGRRIEQLNAYRERVQAVRQSRMQTAEIAARAGNEGTLGASSTIGALGSITSQLSGAFSFANQADKQAAIMRAANAKAAKASSLSGFLGQAASFSGQNLPTSVSEGTKAAVSSFGSAVKEGAQNVAGQMLSFFAPAAAGQSQQFNQSAGTRFIQQ